LFAFCLHKSIIAIDRFADNFDTILQSEERAE
jgi:hypothetical protein